MTIEANKNLAEVLKNHHRSSVVRYGGAVVLSSLFLLSLTACGTSSENVWSSVPKLPVASPVIFQQATGKVALAPITATLPERRSIGTLSRNVGCWVFVRQLTDADFPPAESLTEPANQALAAARLTVTSVASQDINGAGSNDYLLSANIAGAHADMCNNTFMENGPNDVDLEVDVAWKLWSVREKRVVFETSTSGIGHSANKDLSLAPAAGQAMADAVTRLLQTATAQQYLTFGHLALPEPMAAYQQQNSSIPQLQGNAENAAPAIAASSAITAPDSALLLMANVSAPDGLPTASYINDAAVSIGGGQNRGGGVAVGTTGYIITLSANIIDASAIIVTDVSGKKVAAAVLRRDSLTGLALLKTEALASTNLPIEARLSAAGEQVYSLNSDGKLVQGRVLQAGGQNGLAEVSLRQPIGGMPVVNAQGSLTGLIIEHNKQVNKMIPISAVFASLHLGINFNDH